MCFVREVFLLITLIESRLAPLIDKVMSDNIGVYIKSYPMRIENKPHVELHLTIVSSQEQMPNEKLTKTAKELDTFSRGKWWSHLRIEELIWE